MSEKKERRKKSTALTDSFMAARQELSYKYIENRNPKMAALALELLADGVSHDRVHQTTGLDFDTLAALRARHERAIDERRNELALDGFEMAEKMRALANKKANMLMEDEDALKRTSIKDIMLGYAISVDKGTQAMDGGAKTIVEHRNNRPSLADAMKAIEEARKLLNKDAIPVDAVEVKDA